MHEQLCGHPGGQRDQRPGFPNVRDLLSVKDKQAVEDFESECAVVYISGKEHRQWPSVAESTVVFVAKCVGKAREEFIRQLADLKLKQKGFSHRYSFDGGQFTTVTRVVAATAEATAKVIISYVLEALSKKESQMSEPWKSSDAREKMFLMKLRVMETPRQLAAFGWNAMVRDVIPPDQDKDLYFPQYVPVRERCSGSQFCVTWVRKVRSFRELPTAVKADPPPLSTGILFGTSVKALADPYDLFPDWDGEGRSPEEADPKWRYKYTALKRECALCPGVECHRLLPCCACENWVHLECSYGIPEGRLCARSWTH